MNSDHLPRVTLLAHRFAEAQPTGIGRYYREMSLALAAAAGGDVTYELASPREPRPPTWLPRDLPYRVIPGNREALLLSWGLLGRPAVDGRIGTPDLIHVLHPWAPTPTQAPLVVTLHDLMPFLHPEWYGRKARWAGRRGLRAMAQHAAAIVAVSGIVAAQATEHLGIDPGRITVVPEGIAAAFRGAPDRGGAEVTAAARRHGVTPGRYLVAVGQVSTRKNLSPVLRALASLAPLDGDGADLLLCGSDGVGAAAVHREIEALGLARRVRCIGFVGGDELPALIAGALALVHPSLDEGFGFPPLEAMAAGTPAIASTAGSLPEVVGDAGVLVAPHDPTAWAAAIAALRDDPDRRARLVRAGRVWAAQFTWEAAADRVRHLHTDILNRLAV